jgi:quinol monooxygenase YgiN
VSKLLAPIRYHPDTADISDCADIDFRLACFLRGEDLKWSFAERDGKKSALIVFSMEIVAQDQVRAALLRTLGSILEPTRVAPGCLSARLFSDLDKRKALLLVEEWETRDQFERNLDTTKLNVIVGAIELSSAAPVIRIDAVEREEGVDALALHRSAGSK